MARSLRSFIISFLFSLVVMVIVAVIVVPYLNNLILDVFNGTGVVEEPEKGEENLPPEGEGEDNPAGPVKDDDEEKKDDEKLNGNTFSVLIVMPDANGKYADSLMLMKVDKERKQFMFSPLPARLVVNMAGAAKNASGEPVTLSSIYGTHGIEYLKNAVSAITGIKVDYYYTLTPNGFVNLIDSLGSIPVNISYDMKHKDPETDTYDIDLSAGAQNLDGAHALMYITFADYTNGEEGRRTVQTNFIKLALNEYLTAENFNNCEAFFKKLTKSGKTNMKSDAFVTNADLLFKFSSYTIAPTVNFPIISTMVYEDKNYYNYGTQDALNTYANYR